MIPTFIVIMVNSIIFEKHQSRQKTPFYFPWFVYASLNKQCAINYAIKYTINTIEFGSPFADRFIYICVNVILVNRYIQNLRLRLLFSLLFIKSNDTILNNDINITIPTAHKPFWIEIPRHRNHIRVFTNKKS